MPSSERNQRTAFVTSLLVCLQVVVWLVVVFHWRRNEWAAYALIPRAFSLPRLLVSPFLHVHPFHLGVNLAALWLFGSALERAIGWSRFLAIYLGGAWFAGLMHWAVTTATQMDLDLSTANAAIGAVGCSGAIAAVLGAYCVRLPHSPLPILKRWRIAPVGLFSAWLGWEFVQALLSTARGTGAGIGHWAHLAGCLFGLTAASLLGLQRLARREQLQDAGLEAVTRDDFGSAAEAWAAVVRSDPRDAGARLALVQARLALHDRPAAEAVAREGIHLAARSGSAPAALEAYATYLRLIPNLRLPEGVRYRIGCWLADAGRDREALAALLEAAREDAATPAAASALFRAGEIAADRLRDPRRARTAWQRILLDYNDSAWRDRAYERLSQLSGPARRSAGEAEPG